MPSVRFSRDKRGYEYVYLMHTSTRRGRPGRSQVLYWYRTPPGVLIGRKPFSEDVQRMLEAQNPGVAFDWPTIISTPMPPPDMTEFWRERRRAAKAARQQSRSQDADDDASDDAAPGEGASEALGLAGETAPTLDLPVDHETTDEAGTHASAAEDASASKRRRRRGGRRRRSAGELAADNAAVTETSVEQMSLVPAVPPESAIPPEFIDPEDPSDRQE